LKQPTIGCLSWLVSFHMTDPGSSKGFSRKGPVAMELVSRSEFFIHFRIVGNLKSIFCEKEFLEPLKAQKGIINQYQALRFRNCDSHPASTALLCLTANKNTFVVNSRDAHVDSSFSQDINIILLDIIIVFYYINLYNLYKFLARDEVHNVT
jgi:hypothetical protein